MRLPRPSRAVLAPALTAFLFVTLAAEPRQAGVPLPAASSQAGQQAQPQQPTFRTGVKLVRVDVTATGKGERPVDDLKLADFEVTEDGVVQKVEQFQFITLDGQRPAGDDRSLEIRTQEQAEAEAAREDVRVFALFLDDYHVDKSPAVMMPLRRALTSFVDRFWPTDLVAVMDPLTPLSALRFTRSHSQLLDAVTHFEGRQGEVFPVRSAIEEAQLMRGDVVRVRAEVTLSALAALVTHLGGLREGRKVVVFVSQGPQVFYRQDGSLQDRMREIAKAASRGNVTIYPLDPRGLGMMARGSRDTLYQLAAESGGRVIANTNDPTIGLSRVLADTSAYYVLGYQPTRVEDDGRYHKISVRVKRPGVKLLARQGYWAPSGREVETAREMAARTPAPGVTRAMDTFAELAPRRRAADVWIGTSRGEEGRTQLAVTWDPLDGSSGGAAPAALEVEILDVKNGAVIEAAQRIPGEPGGSGTRASAKFSLKPGPALVRVTARSDADSVIDRWALPVSVPDFTAGLMLSTPRVYRARTLSEFKALAAVADRAPGATRRFSRTDRVLVALECVAPAGATPQFQAHLLSKDGRELAPLPLPDMVGSALRFELPVGSLGKGTYILRIRARAGEAAAEQHVAFSVAE